ncbi:MAG: hypothetical protein ACREFP_05445, partial [Acetobacteraceae bacterium]
PGQGSAMGGKRRISGRPYSARGIETVPWRAVFLDRGGCHPVVARGFQCSPERGQCRGSAGGITTRDRTREPARRSVGVRSFGRLRLWLVPRVHSDLLARRDMATSWQGGL